MPQVNGKPQKTEEGFGTCSACGEKGLVDIVDVGELSFYRCRKCGDWSAFGKRIKWVEPCPRCGRLMFDGPCECGYNHA